MIMIRRQRQPESVIVRGIIVLLRIAGCAVWKHWGGPMSKPGVPDIVFTLPGGRAGYCECKTPASRNRVSPAQQRFLKEHAEKGALCFVATSVTEAKDVLVQAGVIKG